MTAIHSHASPAVLSVVDLGVDFPTDDGAFHAVDQVSFEIVPGEVLGMIGESGAGKSMIGSAITRLIDPPGQIVSGEIHFNGKRIDTLSNSAIARLRGSHIGTVFQDPLSSLNPLYTIGRQLIETISRHLPLNEKAARERAIALLTEVGINNAEHRLDAYPHQFSGGMRQRVVIAMAIAADPQLLIADEPTSALDVSVQAQIIALLKRLCADRGLAVLLITHDMGVIAEMADRVVVLNKGRVVEAGPVDEVILAPREDYTRTLIAATPSINQSVARKMRRAVPAALLHVEDLRHDFRIGTRLLPFWRRKSDRHLLRVVDGISFNINEGETYALVGESGSGKSTIARIIAGLLPLGEGRISFDGVPREAKSGTVHRGEVQMVFQDPYASLNPRWRIEDIIAEPIRRLNLEKNNFAIKDRVIDLLEKVRLNPDSRYRYPHEFSGGQRQRIAIARALASRPRFIIFDEPTSALDVSVQAQVLDLMAQLQQEFKLTYLLISHNLAVVRQMADRIGIIHKGTLIEQGAAEDVFHKPNHSYTSMLIASVPDVHAALKRRGLGGVSI